MSARETVRDLITYDLLLQSRLLSYAQFILNAYAANSYPNCTDTTLHVHILMLFFQSIILIQQTFQWNVKQYMAI